VSDRFTVQTLSNGLIVVIETMPDVRSAAAGFLVRTGSRDEPSEQAGASHFLEHMCFKGTASRTWRQINIDFDRLGAFYNAYTSKERTFYFGWVPHDVLNEQIRLLADLMRSVLPPDEFNMEKKVILEEIAQSKDQIEHHVHDLLHEKVYRAHPLSWPILGTQDSVANLTREQLVEYLHRRYAPDNMLLIVAGNVDPPAVLEMAERVTADWTPTHGGQNRQPPEFHPGSAVRVLDRFQMQSITLTFPAPPAADKDEEVAEAVATILGGDNSRFYWEIMHRGIAPRAGAFRLDYHDCGLMALSGMCPPENAEKLTEAMQREAEKITRDGVRPAEVQRVKTRRRTTLAQEAETPYLRLAQLRDDMECRGRVRTVEERLAEVDAITPQHVADYLQRWPITRDGFFLSVGPRDWPPISDAGEDAA
jgi:predicted Zn-dependent peptidase